MSKDMQTTDLEVLYHGETQLVDFGESRTLGKYIKIRLSDIDGDPLAPFRGLDTATAKKTGHILHVTIALGDIAALAEECEDDSKPYGQQASLLYRKGFFYIHDVLRAIGTEMEYADWVRQQPCIVCAGGDWVEIIGERRCEAAHVLRAGAQPAREGENPNKPAYARVPLCRADHQAQHNNGESIVYARYRYLQHGDESPASTYTDDEVKGWFDKRLAGHLKRWASERLAKQLDYTSMGFVPPQDLMQWAEDCEVAKYVPKEYR